MALRCSMGCCVSKPEEPTAAKSPQQSEPKPCPEPAPALAPPEPVAPPRETEAAAEKAADALDPPELRAKLLQTAPSDKHIHQVLTLATDTAKASYESRVELGTPDVISRLCFLVQGHGTTAKLAAQALKILSFCYQNRECASTLAPVLLPILLACKCMAASGL